MGFMHFSDVSQVHYLDHNATSTLREDVKQAMLNLALHPLNPSSVHTMGRFAKQLLEEARTRIRDSLEAPHSKVIFTSSGTEANNLALTGLGSIPLLASSIEHTSVLALVLKQHHLDVTPVGIIDLASLEERIASLTPPFVVSVMAANNETGVIQPIKEVTQIVHQKGGFVHCDASQYYGKLPISIGDFGVDLLTISAHKCGGPQGVGALVISPCIALSPMLKGGAQEHHLRAGTESMAAIIGFGSLASILPRLHSEYRALNLMRDQLETALTQAAYHAIIIGKDAPRLPNTSCIALPGIRYDTQLMHFDLNHIAVSAGSACSSGKIGASHVLRAMQLPIEQADSAIRVSLGHTTTTKDIDAFITCWKHLAERTRKAIA